MDNQTWFDATLVKRFNECNREVTIHRPYVSTPQSNAFIQAGENIKGPLVAAIRSTLMKARDGSVETLGL